MQNKEYIDYLKYTIGKEAVKGFLWALAALTSNRSVIRASTRCGIAYNMYCDENNLIPNDDENPESVEEE